MADVIHILENDWSESTISLTDKAFNDGDVWAQLARQYAHIYKLYMGADPSSSMTLYNFSATPYPEVGDYLAAANYNIIKSQCYFLGQLYASILELLKHNPYDRNGDGLMWQWGEPGTESDPEPLNVPASFFSLMSLTDILGMLFGGNPPSALLYRERFHATISEIRSVMDSMQFIYCRETPAAKYVQVQVYANRMRPISSNVSFPTLNTSSLDEYLWRIDDYDPYTGEYTVYTRDDSVGTDPYLANCYVDGQHTISWEDFGSPELVMTYITAWDIHIEDSHENVSTSAPYALTQGNCLVWSHSSDSPIYQSFAAVDPDLPSPYLEGGIYTYYTYQITAYENPPDYHWISTDYLNVYSPSSALIGTVTPSAGVTYTYKNTPTPRDRSVYESGYYGNPVSIWNVATSEYDNILEIWSAPFFYNRLYVFQMAYRLSGQPNMSSEDNSATLDLSVL